MGFDLRGLALSSLDSSIDLFVRREERPMHLGIGRRLSDEGDAVRALGVPMTMGACRSSTPLAMGKAIGPARGGLVAGSTFDRPRDSRPTKLHSYTSG